MEIPLYTTIQTKLQKEKQKNTTTIYFDSELSKSQQSIWDGFSSHCSESTEYSHYWPSDSNSFYCYQSL